MRIRFRNPHTTAWLSALLLALFVPVFANIMAFAAKDNEKDPFAALMAANEKPVVKYISPDRTAKVVDSAKLNTPATIRTQIAGLLATCIRQNKMAGTESELPLCSRMIGLALQIDPGNATVTNLDSQLKTGMSVTFTAEVVVTRPALAARLLQVATQCRTTGNTGDRKLAVYLLSLASDLDPANKEAVEAYALYANSGIVADWGFTSGVTPSSMATIPPLSRSDAAAVVSENFSEPRILQPTVNPTFARVNKPFARRQNSIKGLMVIVDKQGHMTGETMDIIATVFPSPGGSMETSSISFARPVGRQMGISFDEARRAVQIRYPFWEAARISVSFGEKYASKDGGSAGGAFTLLLLSLLDGWTYEDGFAMTGDVTVDWKIRKVGAVAEKIRGAVRAHCSVVAIPMANERALADMTLLYPIDVLAQAQVFGVETIGEAVEVARADKSKDLAQAMELYRRVQKAVRENSILTLNNASAQSTLSDVLKLAPNHLSAKYLLLYARNQTPRRLSLATSMQEIVAAAGPLLLFLAPVTPAEVSLPDEVYKRVRQNILDLRTKVDKDAEPLHESLCAFVGTLAKMHQIEVGAGTPGLKKTQLKSLEPKFKSDRNKVLAILDGIQENKEFLDRIMNQ